MKIVSDFLVISLHQDTEFNSWYNTLWLDVILYNVIVGSVVSSQSPEHHLPSSTLSLPSALSSPDKTLIPKFKI
jgi:hypothetical protein